MPDAEEIGVHLERAGIGQYTAAFEDAGYDDFAFLSDLPADTLRTELAEGVDDLPKEAIDTFLKYVDDTKAAAKKAKEQAAAAAARPPPPPPQPTPPPAAPKPAPAPAPAAPAVPAVPKELGPPLTDDEVRAKLKAFTEISMTEMTTLFSSLHLDMDQADKFIEEGYDDPNFLKDLSEADIEEIGQTTNMKKGHILRLQCWVKGLIVCTGENEFVVVHRYSGQYLKSIAEEKKASAPAA